jgi:hypothetical protein
LNLPVRAGFRVSGEAKNWENPGSWALAGRDDSRRIIIASKAVCFINSLVSCYE